MSFEIKEIKREHKDDEVSVYVTVLLSLKSSPVTVVWRLPSSLHRLGFPELEVQIRRDFAKELYDLGHQIESEIS